MPTLPATLKDWVEMCVTAAGVIGALLVFIWNASTASKELRRKRAESGRSLNTEMCIDTQSNNAFSMLDMGAGATVSLSEKDEPDIIVTWDQVVDAIGGTGSLAVESRTRITDAFDALFYYFALFNHSIEAGLVQIKDVSYPASYYIRSLCAHKELFAGYLRRYKLAEAETFLKRWSEWNNSRDRDEKRENLTLPVRNTRISRETRSS